jgi:hypothetical protein
MAAAKIELNGAIENGPESIVLVFFPGHQSSYLGNDVKSGNCDQQKQRWKEKFFYDPEWARWSAHSYLGAQLIIIVAKWSTIRFAGQKIQKNLFNSIAYMVN